MLKHDICIACDYRSYGITPVEDTITKPQICDISLKHNGYPNTSHFRHHNAYKSVENRQESHQLDSYDSTPVRWKRKCLKRSSSYTNAVEVARDEISDKHKVRFSEGKFYIGVDNDSSDQETLWLHGRVMVLVLIFNCKEEYICLVVFIVFWKGVGGWEWAGLEGLCVCVFIKVLQRNYMFLSFFSWVFLEEKFTELLSIHVQKSVFLTCGNSFFIIDLLSCNIETQRRILKFDSWKEREYKEKKRIWNSTEGH